MYSQNNEQEFIENYFGRQKGRFLDIGAHDGITYSNTFAIAEQGWDGVLVEANPINFTALRKNYLTMMQRNDYPSHKFNFVNVAIGYPNCLVKFYANNDGLLSTVEASYEEHQEKWRNERFEQYWVAQTTWEMLVSRVGVNFNLISLDVENLNMFLFSRIPTLVFGTTDMIIVEHDNQHEEMASLAKPFGFSVFGLNGENLILAK